MNEEDCKESFDLFDLEMKGELNLDKCKELICSFGINVKDEEINNISSNGKITYNSFLNFYNEKMKEPKNDNLEDLFKNIVSKKNGKISAKKFKKLLMNFGLKFSEDEANEVLEQFKIDEEGNINYKEFCQSMYTK